MFVKLKILFTLPFFLLAIFIIIFSSYYIYSNSKKEKVITIILDELKELSENSITDEELAMFLDKDTKDKRVAIIKAFFRKYESPLYEHSKYIVQISDEFGIDYRLIPAIAMQESTACKFIPRNSYNCWGWGIYGDKIKRFNSYKEGIETVAKGLKIGYINKGLVTPEQIMSKYTPSSNGSWARGVGHVLGVLE